MKIAAKNLDFGDVVGSGEKVLFVQGRRVGNPKVMIHLERVKNGVKTQRWAEWNAETLIGVSQRRDPK